MDKIVTIKATDNKKQIAFGEIYCPDVPDSHGDFMAAEEIEKMAYGFLKSGRLDQIDMNHDNNVIEGSHVVESFIARKCDDTYIPGSWVVGVHIPDKDVWDKIENGEINGFSMEVLAFKKESELELECPVLLVGRTEKAKDGHVHTYTVFINKDGDFTGGRTDEVNGHSHVIKTGTRTEKTEDHTHKYSFIDQILEL